MLTARDPILFFDEVPLYESELDDNGVSQLRVKVRHQSLACNVMHQSLSWFNLEVSLHSGLQKS